MKIKTAEELKEFLKKPNTDIILLDKYLYDLLIVRKWDCPLREDLLKAIFQGLKVKEL